MFLLPSTLEGLEADLDRIGAEGAVFAGIPNT
jgi:hypothetical protein